MAHFARSDRFGRRWVFFRPAPLELRERAEDPSFPWAAGSFLRSFEPADLRALGRALCGLGTTLDGMADEAVLERLERDLASGWLVVCDGPMADEAIAAEHALLASVLRPDAEAAPESAGPRGAREDQRTWFEVQVVDELGEPIAGLPLVVDTDSKQQLTTDGSGSVRIDDVTARYGWARIEDLDGLRELVGPRWDEVREGEWLETAPDHTFVPLRGDELVQVSLLSETPHTIVVQPWVVRARLVGMYFDTNKCFLLPSALGDIRQLKHLYEEYPDSEVLVVGHTDQSGDPSYNDPLSLERADAMADYLTDDVEAWLGWYGASTSWEKRWGAHEDHLMLASLPDYSSRPPGESAVRWFQRIRGLEVDGWAGDETRRQLITEYMAHDETSLPAEATLARHGCGESFPMTDDELAEVAQLDLGGDESNQRHRRVELYFFDRPLGVQPPPPGSNSPPGSPEYPEWRRRALRTHDFQQAHQPDALVLEWPEVLIASLPAEFQLVATWRDQEVTLSRGDAESADGFARFVFMGVRYDDYSTVVAKCADREITLWKEQRASDPDDPPQWTGLIDFLLPDPEPSEEHDPQDEVSG